MTELIDYNQLREEQRHLIENTLWTVTPEFLNAQRHFKISFQKYRHLVDIMRCLQTLENFYPVVFDPNTEQGKKNIQVVTDLIEKEDIDALKDFHRNWSHLLRTRSQTCQSSNERTS